MKKRFNAPFASATARFVAIAAAIACLPGAHAASGATLSGILDIGPRIDMGGTTGSVKSVQSGQMYGSRLDFIGEDDLGDGWKATFVLEAGLTVDDGNGSANPPGATGLTFGRTSAISLGSDRTGYISLGRQYDPIWALSASGSNDPFAGSWLGGNSVIYNNTVISSNSITYSYGYSSRTMLLAAPRQGLGAAVTYAVGEAAAPNENAGNQFGFNVSYGLGPWFVGYAYHQVKGSSAAISVTAPVSEEPLLKEQTLSFAYDFGLLRLHMGYNTGKTDTGSLNRHNWTIGTTVPIGDHQSFRALYGRANDQTAVNADWNALQLGYFYEFSKRTAWYVGYGMVRNNANAATTLGRQVGTYAKGSTPKSAITGIRTNF